MPSKPELTTPQVTPPQGTPDDEIPFKRRTARRLVATLLVAAALMLYAAFYGFLVDDECTNIPTICLSGGTLIVVIAMSIDVLVARNELLRSTQHQPEPAPRPPQAPLSNDEILKTFADIIGSLVRGNASYLDDLTPRSGTFGPRMPCTIVKDNIPRPGFYMQATPTGGEGQAIIPEYLPMRSGPAAHRRPQFPTPITVHSPPAATRPYHAYLVDGEEIFYDNRGPVNKGAQTEAEAKQQPMGQTKPKIVAMAPCVPPGQLPMTEVTIEAAQSESREPPSSVPAGDDHEQAATPERSIIGQDVPDCSNVLRLLMGLGTMAPPNTPRGTSIATMDIPTTFGPEINGYNNVNAMVEKAEEAIYEEPDNVPQRPIFLIDDISDEEADRPDPDEDDMGSR